MSVSIKTSREIELMKVAGKYLEAQTLATEKVMAKTNSGIPYQTLINLYLSDCVTQKRELQLSWK